MASKLFKAIALVLAETFLTFWMFLNSFVTGSVGISLILSALVVGAIQYYRIPPIRASRISDSVMSLFHIDQNNPKKNIIFHKAGASKAPENTMEAVRKAIEIGVAGVEIDLNFSKDGVCVLIHGPKVDGTTDGRGFVHELTYDHLQSLNASAKDANNDTYPNTRIPRLDECVVECVKNNMLIFFDCKGDSTLTVNTLLDLYKNYPELYRLGVVCSFYPQTIYALRQKDSTILTALTIRNNVLETRRVGVARNKEMWKRIVTPFMDRGLTWLHNSFLWYLIGNSFVLLEKGAISPDLKVLWEYLGVRTVAWTVNCPFERHYLTNINGIPVITDGLTTETVVVQ